MDQVYSGKRYHRLDLDGLTFYCFVRDPAAIPIDKGAVGDQDSYFRIAAVNIMPLRQNPTSCIGLTTRMRLD